MEAEFIKQLVQQLAKVDGKIDSMSSTLADLNAAWKAAATGRALTAEFLSSFGSPTNLVSRLDRIETRLDKLDHAHTAGRAKASVIAAVAGVAGAGLIALVRFFVGSGA